MLLNGYGGTLCSTAPQQCSHRILCVHINPRLLSSHSHSHIHTISFARRVFDDGFVKTKGRSAHSSNSIDWRNEALRSICTWPEYPFVVVVVVLFGRNDNPFADACILCVAATLFVVGILMNFFFFICSGSGATLSHRSMDSDGLQSNRIGKL